jgi:hypothetical protein
MNAVWLVIVAICLIWFVGMMAVLWVDSREKTRHRMNLELRDWQEKVDAMRRMVDREGDA